MCESNSSTKPKKVIIKHLNSNENIKSVAYDELPEEFKRFDKPFGFSQHVVNRVIGTFAHASLVYYLFFVAPNVDIHWVGPTVATTIVGYIGGLGTTVGAHRYWTHKTFKANKPLQILLMLMQTLSGQYPIFKWCRDHRVHHKYVDTNADPHSSARGFWFSHVIWLFVSKHPDLEKSYQLIDISDLAKDPIVRFQSRHYYKLILLVFFAVPMTIFHLLFPCLTFMQLIYLNFSRWIVEAHISFLVNSVAHKYGDKPYDKCLTSVDNKLVSFFTMGEGWHNYHHTFPWDYKAAEFGYKYNLSTVFIYFFAWIGWAWDLKTVSHQLLVDRINRTGSKDHPFHKNHNDLLDQNYNVLKKEISYSDDNQTVCWGWGDKDMRKDDVDVTELCFPLKNH